MRTDSTMWRDMVYITRWVGDYHAPRLLALQAALAQEGRRLGVVQLATGSRLYNHRQKRRERLLNALDFHSRPCRSGFQEARETWVALRTMRPRDILVLGYNDPISLTALAYARLVSARVHFLSDSKADDQPRSRATEAIKRLILKGFDGALVAGQRHVDYFRSLGFSGPIETPYDVIDNTFFASRSAAYRRRAADSLRRALPSRYVLCVSRLVARKRVGLALELYAASGLAELGVGFVLVGDGPEATNLRAKIEALGLGGAVQHCREVPNHRMPALYSGAEALILASEYDQWGLCVNEAMACGVPAFVTARCGVAEELVTPETGVVFGPETIPEAARALRHLIDDPTLRVRLSQACTRRMKSYDCADFAGAALRLSKGITL